jgi:hypothetical protein
MRPFFGRIVLNDTAPGPGLAPGAAAEALQRGMLGVVGGFTRPDGRLDYRALRGSRTARLAFWINLYNALVFHAVVALGIRRTVWEVRGFYRRVCYRVGGFVLSADDIEHGILRGNARHGWLGRRRFGTRDPRLALAVHPVDPRVHFAITCGARSCPPVGAYRAAALDQQLDLAARNFVNQEVQVDGQGRVACSRILQWYAKDFEATGGLGAFLARHLEPGPAREAVGGRARPCDVYRRYDWALQHEPAE